MSGIKTSARNMFQGKVKKVSTGAVNSEIVLDIGGQDIVSVITNESAKSLDLKEGGQAYALIKASWVILTDGVSGLKVSARNCLTGTVDRITRGAVNSEVAVKISGNRDIVAVITNASLDSLGLKEGGPAGALIKASHVIMAVDA